MIEVREDCSEEIILDGTPFYAKGKKIKIKLRNWNEKVEDLPYGLQKRVDVVRALASNPSILVLDDPAAGLPTAEALEMMKKVQEYATHISAGVLIIEHNVELVADVSERIIVLDAGKTIADGTPEEVTRNEQVIAAYLGT